MTPHRQELESEQAKRFRLTPDLCDAIHHARVTARVPEETMGVRVINAGLAPNQTAETRILNQPLTQEEVGQLVGVSSKTVGAWERYHDLLVKSISREQIAKLEEVLGADELLDIAEGRIVDRPSLEAQLGTALAELEEVRDERDLLRENNRRLLGLIEQMEHEAKTTKARLEAEIRSLEDSARGSTSKDEHRSPLLSTERRGCATFCGSPSLEHVPAKRLVFPPTLLTDLRSTPERHALET